MNADARTTHYRACHLCEAICGLVIQTEGEPGDEKIVSIKGDPNDPLSRGHICPKAVALKDIHEDPDRLRRPIKRVMNEQGDANWEEISWDEALQIATDWLEPIRKENPEKLKEMQAHIRVEVFKITNPEVVEAVEEAEPAEPAQE